MRRAAALIAVSLLSACASTLPPPGAPTTAQIAAAAADINAAGVSPPDYASIGITLAQKACADWFSSQVAQSQATNFGMQALSTLGGVAAATGTPQGAGAAMGAGILASILGSAQASLGAGASPAMVYGLVERVQQAWLGVMPTPMTTADAYALVESFAEQCNLPNIQNAVMMALTSVPVVAASTSWTPPGAPAVAERSLGPAPRQSRSGTSRWRPPPNHQTTSSPLTQEWDAVSRLGRAEAERRIIPPRVCVGGCR